MYINESRLERAIELATQLHEGQVDRAGEPYILHPLAVMLKMKTQEERIVAVLHDAVEDCDLSLIYVGEKFGDRIKFALDAVSRRDGEIYMEYIRRLAFNDFALKVKMADLENNLERIESIPIEAERESLRKKYTKALDYLKGEQL